MKTLPILALVPLTLSPAGLNLASAQAPQTVTAEVGNELTPAAILSTQISEIAYSNSLSHAAKEKRISSVLALAVNGAITGLTDANQIVQVASELAVECVKAAPEFAVMIGRSISSLPAIAKIHDAAIKIQTSVAEALEALSQVEVAVPAPTLPKAPSLPEFGGRTSDTVVSRSR